MVASYDGSGSSFNAGKPRWWGVSNTRLAIRDFAGFRAFDLHPDGQRFAVLKEEPDAKAKADRVVLVLNFFDELRRLAPAK